MNQSHTELAAQLQRLDFELRASGSPGLPPEACRIIDAALESPERGLGELVTVRLPTLTPEQAADVHWGLSEALVDAGRIDDGRMLLFVGEAATQSTQAEKQNALRPDHPLAAGRCVHNVAMSDDCRACAPKQSNPRKPLTEDEIEQAFQEAAGADEETHIRFARAIEAAHGIVTKETPNAS